MNKKDIFTVVVIAAVVGFLSASLGAQVGMSPRGHPTTGVFNENVASSCDLDGTCEVVSIRTDSMTIEGSGIIADGTLNIITDPTQGGVWSGNLNLLGNLDIWNLDGDQGILSVMGESHFGGESRFSNTAIFKILKIGEVFMINDEGNGYLAGQMEFGNVDTEELEVEGPANFFELSGNGTAFVCTNNMGRIYSSQEPCN